MKTVAVIGASNDRSKFGNKALRAFRTQGYKVVPINPTEREIEGERAYVSVLDYADEIDEATLYVNPRVGEKVLDDIATKGIGTVWLNPGADAPNVIDRAKALGLHTIRACSIIAIGDSPSRY
ncbi:MAG: CoA-binding protein [Acidobacteriota bacterium]|nr:CoA-binding protein [Acidobacteriota bacterium]